MPFWSACWNQSGFMSPKPIESAMQLGVLSSGVSHVIM